MVPRSVAVRLRLEDLGEGEGRAREQQGGQQSRRRVGLMPAAYGVTNPFCTLQKRVDIG